MSVSELTGIEIKILELSARGYDNDYIAKWVKPRPKNVEDHLADIYRKLEIPRAKRGESDKTKAVAMARRAGLLAARSVKNPSRHLTPREQEAGQGIVDGLTNSQIATRLGIGENGVKQLISSLRIKTLAKSRPELADILLQLKLVQ